MKRRNSTPLMQISRRVLSSSSAIIQQSHFDTVRVCDLIPSVYRRLLRLNFGADGVMATDLKRLRRLSKTRACIAEQSYVTVATHPSHGIIGWALLFNERRLRQVLHLSPLHGKSWTAQFYVKKAMRCQGIGSELYRRLQMIRKTFYKYRHDSTSSAFFRKNARY